MSVDNCAQSSATRPETPPNLSLVPPLLSQDRSDADRAFPRTCGAYDVVTRVATSRVNTRSPSLISLLLACLASGLAGCGKEASGPMERPLQLPGHSLGARYVLTHVDGRRLPTIYASTAQGALRVYYDTLYFQAQGRLVEAAEIGFPTDGGEQRSRLTYPMTLTYSVFADSSVEVSEFVGGPAALGLPSSGVLVLVNSANQEWRFEAR